VNLQPFLAAELVVAASHCKHEAYTPRNATVALIGGLWGDPQRSVRSRADVLRFGTFLSGY